MRYLTVFDRDHVESDRGGFGIMVYIKIMR